MFVNIIICDIRFGINYDCLKTFYKNYIYKNDKSLKKVVRKEIDLDNLFSEFLFKKIIANYSFFHKKPRNDLQKCILNHKFSFHNCNKKYGKDNCEINSSNIVSNKCKKYYKKYDLNICKKNCVKKEAVNCNDLKSYYINEKVYDYDYNCIIDNKLCEKIVLKDNKVKYKAKCSDDHKNISSLCVPYCQFEMKKLKKKIKDRKYCWREYTLQTDLFYNIY